MATSGCSGPHEPKLYLPATETVAAEDGDNGAQPSLRPIYVWNPSASTETFPSVPTPGGEADPPAAEQPSVSD